MHHPMFTKAAFATALLCAFASQAQAGGFQLTEQSALSMGRAYAGAGVDGQDISGVFYNPASMTLDQGTRFQLGTIVADLDLAYESAKNMPDSPTSTPYGGRSDNGRKSTTPIPYAYAAHQINDMVQVGLSVTAPFGLETEFSDDWDQAFRGTSSGLQVVDINPSIAFKLSDKFSIGFGVSAQHADAKLKYNFAQIADYQLGKLSGNEQMKKVVGEKLEKYHIDSKVLQTPGLKDEIVKGLKTGPILDVRVKDWAWGWNVGMLWKPVDTVRIGLSYRSAVSHHAKGDATVGSIPLVAQGLKPALGSQEKSINLPGSIENLLKTGTTAASISMDAPAWAMLSTSWDINPTYTLSSMVRWTNWSTFKSLSLKFDDLGGFTKEQRTDWRDTWFVAVGLDAHLNEKLTVRGGVGYESGVIKDPKTRSGAIPDADRVWLTAGASYKFTKNLQGDFSAAYVRGVGERSLYDDEGKRLGEFNRLNGVLIGAQVQYRF